jgi:ATP-binding cassette subfamily F protein uup
VLMLDEPTNHLDVEGVAWLAEHLRTRVALRSGALAVVTHDRWFLDAVCETTWEVQGGAVYPYEGSYAAYVLAKAERSRQAASEEQRRQNLLRKELAWLQRGAPARTTKAKYRVDAANVLIEAEPPPRDPDTLMRFASARLGRTVVDLEHVTLRAGDRTLLEQVTWQLGPGDRIGVVGVNGAGKTTFLRLLAGAVEPAAGSRRIGVTVKAAYLSQEVRELPATVGPERRVLEAVEDVKRVLDLGGGRTITAGQLCERFGFVGEQQRTPIRDLSGGERRRLQLLRLLMEGPNFLLLDEPTNDLDVETLNALEDLLDGWAGSLVVVSHDRYFLERVCDRTVGLLGDGALRDLPRGVEEYLELRRRIASPAPAARPPAPGGTSTAAEERATRKELARIERRLDKLVATEAQLHEDLAGAATEYERLAGLDAQLRAVVVERTELEEQWLTVSEQLD